MKLNYKTKESIPSDIGYCYESNEFRSLNPLYRGVRKNDAFFSKWVSRKNEFPKCDRKGNVI